MKRAGAYARIAFGLFLWAAGMLTSAQTNRTWLGVLSGLVGGFWCGWGAAALRRSAE